MSTADSEPWTDENAPLASRILPEWSEERQALIDRIIGLEAQVDELTGASHSTPSEQLALEQRLIAMQESFEWRLGRAITSPRRVVRRLRRR